METPGIRTTEFWLTLFTNAAALLVLVNPGFEVTAWAQPAAIVASSLATLFYTLTRGQVKRAVAMANAVKAAAKPPRKPYTRRKPVVKATARRK